jgi:hypothetical protein
MINHLADQAQALKPGHCLSVQPWQIKRLALMQSWVPEVQLRHPTEIILGGIMGSAYDYTYWDTLSTGGIVIARFTPPLDSSTGMRGWVEADRQHYFERRPDGLYQLKSHPQP